MIPGLTEWALDQLKLAGMADVPLHHPTSVGTWDRGNVWGLLYSKPTALNTGGSWDAREARAAAVHMYGTPPVRISCIGILSLSLLRIQLFGWKQQQSHQDHQQ